jgi:hypothetical protein
MFCLPALTTAAFFTAVIIFDLINKKTQYAKGHFLLSVPSVLLMQYLCDNGSPYIGWGLLFVPFLIILISFLIVTASTNPSGSIMPANIDYNKGAPVVSSHITASCTIPTTNIPETDMQNTLCNKCNKPSRITPCELCRERSLRKHMTA